MKKVITIAAVMGFVLAVVTALADELPPFPLESRDVGTMLYLEEAPGHSHPKRFQGELFLANRLPAVEAAEDYDEAGRVRLGPEYGAWLASPDNWLGTNVATTASRTALRITFPPAGTTIFLDPDLPAEGRRLEVSVTGASRPEWESETLSFEVERGRTIALLEPGRHRLVASDPETGRCDETWVEVKRR